MMKFVLHICWMYVILRNKERKKIMIALFSGIFKMVQKTVQPISKSKIGVLMKNSLNRQTLASAGNIVGKASEYTYVGTGVPLEGMMDSLTNQR